MGKSKSSVIADSDLIKIIFLDYFFKLMTILTRFEPFRMFWRDRYFHYEARHIARVRDVIKYSLLKYKLYPDYITVDPDSYFYHYNVPLRNKKITKEIIETIENKLNIQSGIVLIKETDFGYILRFPTEIMLEIKERVKINLSYLFSYPTL